MLSGPLHILKCQAGFNRSSGMVTSAQGMTGDEGMAAVVLVIMFGMFLGLIAGILAQNLLRFYAMCCGRPIGSTGWAIGGGVLLGAAISAWLAMAQSEG